MLVNLKSLVQRLNPTVRSALESAAGLCLGRTHYDIEVEHFLLKLLDTPDCDFARIVRFFGMDMWRLSAELTNSLDRLRTGNSRTPFISPSLINTLVQGWTYGSLNFGATVIRTGFVIFALIADDELSRLVFEFSREMRKIELQPLKQNFANIVVGSVEDEPVAIAAAVPGDPKVSGGPHIFISYRREDSALYADFLFACLRAEVPNVRVFRDSDTLQPGMLFSEKIEETIAACDIMLALIGKKWFGGKEGCTCCINQENDWIRREIAVALRLKKWVIPCLVDGAKMPAKRGLPPDLVTLPDRHAIVLSLKELQRNVDGLLESLRNWRR